MKFLTSLPLLLLTAGCWSGSVEVLPGAGDYATDAKIFNGSAPDAAEHDAVVGLHQLTNNGTSVYVSPFCTGTLIAPDVVLTAAHCLDTANGGRRFSTMSPDSLAIYVGDDPQVDIVDHLYAVSETLIYTGYNRRSLRNDIAIVRLSVPITENVAPVPNLPASLGFTNGDAGGNLNFAGFGQTETGSSGVKLQVDLPLGGLGCAVSGCSGGDSATQISYAQGGQGGPCFGDSGGPAFFDRAGAPYVAGITSYGDQYCTVYGVSTRVDAFEGWIADFVGTTEPPVTDDTGDSDPGTPSDCGNGVCDDGESCDGRDFTDACSTDCDGRVNGNPRNRYCYVGDTCEGSGCP